MLKNTEDRYLFLVRRAKSFLESEIPGIYRFHNLFHTERVVRQAKKFAFAYQMNSNDSCYLILAAWMHDLGYVEGPSAHEYRSAKLAQQWMEEQGYHADEISTITELISATNLDKEPITLLQACLRDADLEHLYNDQYFEVMPGLIDEWKIGNLNFNKEAAKQKQLEFLGKLKFHTDYANYHYSSKLKKLMELINQV